MNRGLQYIDLSFINSYEEIKKQIRNTVAISFLMNKGYKATTLNSYLESTQYGYTASANQVGTHRLLRITDIISGKVNWDNVPYCDCNSEEKYLLSRGDILIARTGGTTGKSFLIDNAPSNAIFASYLIRLRIKKYTNPEFIRLFLNSYAFWSQISKLKSGSAQPNVNAEKLKTLIIPECTTKIQNKLIQLLKDGAEYSNDDFIVSLKRNIDAVVSRLDQLEFLKKEFEFQQTYLQQLRQSILQEAVQGKLTQQDPTDEPASKLLERIKAEKQKLIAAGKLKKEKELPPITKDEIPVELPEGWVWCRLGEAGQINPRNDYDENKESSFIPMTLISSDFGVIPNFEIRKWKEIKSGFTHFAENDVAVAKITPCFENSKAAIFKGLINGIGAGTTELHIFRGNVNHIIPEYVYIFFKTPNFLKDGEGKMTGSAGQKRVPSDFVKNALFPLPPFFEQQRIAAKVQQMLKMINQLEHQVQQSQTQAQQLLQAVLKEAFSKAKVYEENEMLTMAAEELIKD